MNKFVLYVKREARAKGSFMRGVLTLVSGTTLAQAIPLVLAPVTSRIYVPKDYGFFALFGAVSAIIGVFVSGRYELAIMLPKQEEDAATITLMSIAIACAVSITVLIGIPLISVCLAYAGLADMRNLRWLYWIPLSVLLTGVYQPLTYWHNRRGEYKSLAISRICQTVSTSFGTIGLGLLQTKGYGLITGSCLGLMTAVLILATGKSGRTLFWGRKNAHKSFSRVAYQYKDFPLFSLPGALLDVFSNQIPVVLIGRFFSTSAVGLYSFAMKTLSLPVSLIGNAVGQVFYQKFSQNVNLPKRGLSLLLRTWLAIGGASFLPFLFVFLFGQSVFGLVFGKNWIDAGKMASILSPMLFVLFVSSPTSTTYTALRLQHLALSFGIAVIVYRPAALYVGALNHDLYLGFRIFVVCEIAQVFLYNAVILKKLWTDKTHSDKTSSCITELREKTH
jgi:O-antigen/teichoic acid export membrane protein